MVSLDCESATTGDVTLVTLVLESDEATHVRIENCLDGPVWPPRRQGVPAAGWDDDGFEGVVDGHLALGYASPAAPADPPARIVDQRPPTHESSVAPESLVREFGAGTPPRDAVGSEPTPAVSATNTTVSDQRGGSADTTPAAVTAWLGTVEGRLDDADRLASATSLDDAADAVASVGGPDEVYTLSEQVATDREVLCAVADRCERLADRAETVEIPVETLARLA